MIYLITHSNGYFGRGSHSWKGLDVGEISQYFMRSGLECIVLDVSELISLRISPDDVILSSLSENEEVRAYLMDVLYLFSGKCMLIPAYEHLMAYENKGFQQIYRERNGFGNLKGSYVLNILNEKVVYPVVLKELVGAGSKTVKLCSNKKELERIARSRVGLSFLRKVVKLIRRFTLSKDDFSEYCSLYFPYKRLVCQDFIPALDCDYKVLVFGEKYYCLKRSVRGNDFRASGSGLFEFAEIASNVLEFSRSIRENVDSPYISMDIAARKEGCSLIEYQCTNFGPYTLLNASFYYRWVRGGWEKCIIDYKVSVESELASSVIRWLRGR